MTGNKTVIHDCLIDLQAHYCYHTFVHKCKYRRCLNRGNKDTKNRES